MLKWLPGLQCAGYNNHPDPWLARVHCDVSGRVAKALPVVPGDGLGVRSGATRISSVSHVLPARLPGEFASGKVRKLHLGQAIVETPAGSDMADN